MTKRAKIIRKTPKKSDAPKPGRNPPEQYRFKKGVSGNSKGRPKGSKNLKTLVMEAAADQVAATVNGKSRKISKLQATVMQLATKAAGGDHKAMGKFLELVDEMETRASTLRPEQYPLGEPDLEVLRATYKRMKLCRKEGDAD
ncbi:DUF5681 domain-containing protein [Nitrobacter sp. TKz-YC01]|uniref:DUF5681 domain-containing protein n=1 Tax=Nitrobacter sp. TKz-YC01 TaxID=3398703 RepID=UPI003A0FD9BB